MNESRRVNDHPLLGKVRVYRPDLPPYDADADDEPGTLVVGNGMSVTVLAAFHDWNGVSGLDMLYVRCHETGLSTHVTPSELGDRVTTVDDGRVRFRGVNVTVASCDRCDFRSGLTECLCDHWHDCADGPYEPECDVLCHSCGATTDGDLHCDNCRP